MYFWQRNPELLEKITINFLPEPWKSDIENEKINLADVPEEIMQQAMVDGTEDYWATRTDHLYHEAESERFYKDI